MQLHNTINDMKNRPDVIINEFSQVDTSARSKLSKSQVIVFLGEFGRILLK